MELFGLRCFGDCYRDPSSLSRPRFHLYSAFVSFYGPFTVCEFEADALGFRGIEGFEEVLHLVLRDADPGVGDLDGLSVFVFTSGYRQGASVRHGLGCVSDEVVHDPPHFDLI